MSVEKWVNLSCHPATRSDVVRAIRTRVDRLASRELRISYRLEGAIASIRIPRPSKPVIGIELWRHTCFEAFIAIEGRAAYHEFNFAPSSEWTVYAFSGYRKGAALADETLNPEVAVRRTASRLELDALIRLDRLSALHPRTVLCLGLAAVIESSDGLSYWALNHPADKPDFHRADGVALRLEPLEPKPNKPKPSSED
jgi:hypothetical protein